MQTRGADLHFVLADLDPDFQVDAGPDPDAKALYLESIFKISRSLFYMNTDRDPKPATL